MILGDKECNWEISYFMKNGKYPPAHYSKPTGVINADIRDCIEREWREPDMQYMLWQGCRFGNMDWIQ